MPDLPKLALSIRQPWAWAIIHAGKDIENRSWGPANPSLKFRGRVAIHASSGITRYEFDDAIETIDEITGPEIDRLPQACELVRGAIVGSVEVVDVVRGSMFNSKHGPWFFGPVGLVLRDPVACEPIPCKGKLGFFEWHETGACVPPAKWMLPPEPKAVAEKQPAAMPLFDRS